METIYRSRGSLWWGLAALQKAIQTWERRESGL